LDQSKDLKVTLNQAKEGRFLIKNSNLQVLMLILNRSFIK